MSRNHVSLWLLGWAFASASSALALNPPNEIIAEGHDSRIDIVWQRINDSTDTRYAVYRAEQADGPWERLTPEPYRLTVYTDFLGKNDVERFYRVTTVAPAKAKKGVQPNTTHESKPSKIVSARTRTLSDEELLESIQKGTFRYFWDFAHPISGLSREGLQHPTNTTTSGGSGFGMIAIMIGAERGWITREAAAEHLLKSVRFLDEKTPRYKGVWSHWIHGETGKTITFAGKKDDGGDIVETAFLVQGMLTVAQYFDHDNPTERELRERIQKLWHSVEWDWYLRDSDNRRLYWHWSPTHQWEKGHKFGGHFNECLITYLLGMASPTHSLPLDTYNRGWLGDEPTKYGNGKEFFGFKQPVGFDMGGPLFFTHYSFMGFDPRALTDRYTNYFASNRIITQINHAYCANNPKQFTGYSDACWGLTASFDHAGYRAHNPNNDNGTISPTAALSAMPYAPELSFKALRHFYHDRGHEIWGPLGFYDAFNPEKDWVSDTFLAIDQGPIVVMIENYRTQLPWRMFMQNPGIMATLKKADLLTPGYKPIPDLDTTAPLGAKGLKSSSK